MVQVERQLTPAEAAQAELVWRLARKASFLQGEGAGNFFTGTHTFAPAAQESSQQLSAGTSVLSASQAPRRSLKLSSIVDQGDDTEVGGVLLSKLRVGINRT